MVRAHPVTPSKQLSSWKVVFLCRDMSEFAIVNEMENKTLYDVAIVGAGASGMLCALQCARAGKRVILFEKEMQVGRKILVSGNGRCNLTNAFVSAADYHGATDLAASILKQFPFDTCLQFFHELGVLTVQENAGRVFPLSGKSTAVAEALRLACIEAGAEILLQTEIVKISKQKEFTLTSAKGEKFSAKKCVLACGSCAYPQAGGTQAGYKLAQSLGHNINTPHPALCAVNVKEKAVARLQGIRVQVKATAARGTSAEISSSGELLFTSYGLSGPAILNISGTIGQLLNKGPVTVELDLLPPIADKKAFLKERAKHFKTRNAKGFFAGVLHENIANLLIDFAGIRKNHPVLEWNENTWQTVEKLLGRWPFTIVSLRPWKEAMIATGGVKCAEINYNNLESRCCQGLYVLGELLDVDGRSGGLNLHFAWGCGYVAAKAIVEE